MTWFKVDDGLHEHRKARRAGLEAMGLWTLAGSYAADNLTDGFVPEHTLTRWCPSLARGRKLAGALVAAGLWAVDEDDGEPGWRFHDWHEQNPDARSVQVKRDAESKGGQHGNHLRWHVARRVCVPECPWCNPNRVPDQVPDGGGDSGPGESPPNPPSRPDPSRPETVVTTPSRRQSTNALDDDELHRVEKITGGNHAHALRVVDSILERATTPPNRPLAYVLRAIGAEPDRYKPTGGVNPGKGDRLCTQPGHTDRADGCRQCASERAAGD